MATESQLPYRQVNICASLEMTTKWIPARKPPISPSLTTIYNLFMQNEANLVRRRRIANSVCIMNYEEKSDWTPGENEPNSKPNKANWWRPIQDQRPKTQDQRYKSWVWSLESGRKGKIDAMCVFTKGYENEPRLRPAGQYEEVVGRAGFEPA